MKKLFFAIITCFFLITGCDREEDAVILLSDHKIDPSNFTHENRYPVFKQRQRIYYILASKEAIEDTKLRLQVIKLDMKYPYYAIEVAYGTNINRGKEKYYVTDYFVLHKAGNYVIRIFGFSDLQKPIAEAEFLVEAL